MGGYLMKFSMQHMLGGPAEVFTEHDAPDWPTSKRSIPGSTMDMRWFWGNHVLKLKVGRSVKTDFHTITRVE